MPAPRSFRLGPLSGLPKPVTSWTPTSRPSTSALAFATSALTSDALRKRSSPAKVAERVKKIERKRAEREIRAESDKATRMENKLDKMTRQVDVLEQREIAEDFTANVAEYTDDQLDAIYRGLMLATPEQLADPLTAIAGPSSSPSLPSPDAGALATQSDPDREATWAALEARLDEHEQAEVDGALEAWETEKRENAEEMDELRAEGRLADRLRERREGKRAERAEGAGERGGEVGAVQPATSRARYLLERLVELAPKEAQAATEGVEGGSEPVVGEGSSLSVPTGVAVRDEWRSLLLACAEEGETEAVLKGLEAMQRSVRATDATLVTELIQVYGKRQQPRDAIALSIHAKRHGIPLSVTSHHHLLASITPANPALALKHLHTLETAGLTPLQKTYTLLIRRLLAPRSPPAHVQRGWDLFAHARLVAHPTPSPDMYAVLIAACARGKAPSPERALDLFTEMTEDNGLPATSAAYSGVIRACAREGSQKWYFEGLRLLRRMLRDNVPPSRATFHAVLEGAVRQGDLPRARWVLVKMVGVGGVAAPNASTLGLVLRSYAEFEVVDRQKKVVGKFVRLQEARAKEERAAAADLAGDRSGGLAEAEDAADVTTARPRPSDRPDSGSTIDSSSLILDLLSDSPLHYPGPLPTTSDELVQEATHLLYSALPLLSTSAATGPSLNFPAVVPTAFLFDSFLRVLCAHGTLDQAVAFYGAAYAQCGVERTGWTFEVVMERCGRAKNRDRGEEVARRVFGEWEEWSGEGTPAAKEAGVAGAERAEADVRAGLDGEEGASSGGVEAEERSQAGKGGNNAGKMWAALIHVLARNFKDTEALTLLQQFIARYPPSALPPTPSASASTPLPALASPLRLANALYPETSGTRELRPHILFEHVRLLHLRLAGVEDRRGVAVVKGVTMAYEGALRGLVRRRQTGARGKKEERVREKQKERREQKGRQ